MRYLFVILVLASIILLDWPYLIIVLSCLCIGGIEPKSRPHKIRIKGRRSLAGYEYHQVVDELGNKCTLSNFQFARKSHLVVSEESKQPLEDPALAALKAALSPDDYEFLEMRIVAGYSQADIARKLGKPPYAICRWQQKIIKTLKRNHAHFEAMGYAIEYEQIFDQA